MDDLYFMKEAYKEALKGYKLDEVPVGCVIVKDDKIIARAHNEKEKYKNALLHAEMVCLKKAMKKIGDYRLNDLTLYVTLEPCIMCTGALVQSRVKRVVFGAYDLKGGGTSSLLKINEVKGLNHYYEIQGGILEEECSSLLKTYFKNKRKLV